MSARAASGAPTADLEGWTEGEFESDGIRHPVFEKGSGLVTCVNEALAELTSAGTLDQLQQQWLSDVVDVPVLQ